MCGSLYYAVTAIIFNSQKDLDEAAKELSLAVQLAPKFAPAHQELGNALMLLGLKDKADQHFKLAQTLE